MSNRMAGHQVCKWIGGLWLVARLWIGSLAGECRMGRVNRSTVSVVIPCHNGEAFLEETLLSVRAQLRQPDEIIVVDDASTDGSAEIARRLGATCIPTGVNVGLPAARNFGIRHARGSLIALLDADDVWLPDHLRSVVDLLERHPETGVGFGRVRLFGI